MSSNLERLAGWLGVGRWSLIPLAAGLVLALWLAADGRLSGDEPSYLYVAAYQSVPEILAGDVQPSGIPGFLQGRVLHLLFIKAVMGVGGPGETGFRVLQLVHLTILALNLGLIARITRALLPGVAGVRAAALALAMAPVCIYLALKTTADNEALLAALVATYGLLRIARGGGAAWMCAAGLGLAAAALVKNQMIFVPAAFWLDSCLVPIDPRDRRRLAARGALCGIGAALLTVFFLEASGIGVAAYLESYRAPFDNRTPLAAKVMNLGTELGLLWFLLPIALWSRRRREVAFYGTWFLASMAPFLFFSGAEPRHLAVNLAAGGGLLALGLETMARDARGWNRLGDTARAALGLVGALLLAATNAVALAIMPHKVDLPALDKLLAGLDARYGEGDYALLAADAYASFHIVRVLWPERDVTSVSTDEILVNVSRASRREILDRYLDGRYQQTLDELRTPERPLVLFGYRKTFAAANLRRLFETVSPALAERVLGGVYLVEHLYTPETKWLWGSLVVRLSPILQAGNYQAMEIQFRLPGE